MTSDERRETLRQLIKLESLAAELRVERDFLEREKATCAKEKDNFAKETELLKREGDLTKRELELEKRRADFFEQAYKSVTKGRSKTCTFLKIISIGIAKCH